MRELTHTLQLPPAHAEIYGGPDTEWLRDCLERLPKLQSLILNGLPILDHSALLTLRQSSAWWKANHADKFPAFGMRLLEAAGCINTTSSGLSEALRHFPDLVSLNLSGTTGVRDAAVLSTLKEFPSLRVLRLAGVGLRDADFAVVASGIGTRVRSLDISKNNLTDASVDWLLDYCIKPYVPPENANRVNEDEPSDMMDLDRHVRSKLTQTFIGRLAVEEAHGISITHLCISSNPVTIDGVARLLKSRQLQVLDVGTILGKHAQGHDRGATSKSFDIHGIEDLTAMISMFACRRLLYLRIHHVVVTKEPGSSAPFRNTPQPHWQASTYAQRSRWGEPPKPELPRCFHPDTLPKLQVLVLTGIPSHTTDASIPAALIFCINYCAFSWLSAERTAKDSYKRWRLPPKERYWAKKSPALRRIVLEIVPTAAETVSVPKKRVENSEASRSGWRHQGSSSLSMTEDPDSDVFWKAASEDFSFFDGDGNGEEECGVLREEADRNISIKTARGDGLIVADEEGEVRSQSSSAQPVLDVVSELAKFRREKREAYNAAVQQGEADPEIEGYWPGDVTVVRMPLNGETSVHGYESGWIYR